MKVVGCGGGVCGIGAGVRFEDFVVRQLLFKFFFESFILLYIQKLIFGF